MGEGKGKKTGAGQALARGEVKKVVESIEKPFVPGL